MGNPIPPDPRMKDLLRQLNELIAEAKSLQQHIEMAAHEKPVWPERRRTSRLPANPANEPNE
jgi:hypothetical protein